ncbi:MAG: cupin domain-containing protein [Spirochaetes bacterium]|nr:cupin domain-containing protein [Spirochaetota bacterium]
MVGKHSEQNYIKMLEGIQIKTLVHGKNSLMSKFLLDKGITLPAHRHPYEQTGYLISGEIILYIDDKQFPLKAGDSWTIPENIEHKAEILEDSIALEIFVPLREDYLPYLDQKSLID